MPPTKETALQFAIMISSGMPTRDALVYFVPPDINEQEFELAHQLWTRSKVVQDALLKLQGKPWQEMTPDEMVDFALAKQYKEMAYYLVANNYCELTGHDRAKADTIRQALEAKRAGTAGQLNALEQWLSDLKMGKVFAPAKKPAPVVPEA